MPGVLFPLLQLQLPVHGTVLCRLVSRTSGAMLSPPPYSHKELTSPSMCHAAVPLCRCTFVHAPISHPVGPISLRGYATAAYEVHIGRLVLALAPVTNGAIQQVLHRWVTA
jgi:hypothetical protein